MKLVQRALQSLLVIAGIFAIALALTFYAFYEDIKSAQLNQTKTFEEQQKLITSAIDDKLHIYEQLLRSGSALFYSSDNVTREEWRLFVETVQLNKHWPGIQGIGYATESPRVCRRLTFLRELAYEQETYLLPRNA